MLTRVAEIFLSCRFLKSNQFEELIRSNAFELIYLMTVYIPIFQHGFPLWKKVIAGMTAGGFGQFIASPTDLIKTQIQMEGKRRLLGKPPRVDGMIDAFR